MLTDEIKCVIEAGMSNIVFYKILMVLIATLLTEGQSCINATTRFDGTESSVDVEDTSCRAISLPARVVGRSIRWHTCCLIVQTLSM